MAVGNRATGLPRVPAVYPKEPHSLGRSRTVPNANKRSKPHFTRVLAGRRTSADDKEPSRTEKWCPERLAAIRRVAVRQPISTALRRPRSERCRTQACAQRRRVDLSYQNLLAEFASGAGIENRQTPALRLFGAVDGWD